MARKQKRLITTCFLFTTLFLAACGSFNHTQITSSRLLPSTMMATYNNNARDLSAQSKCGEAPTVKVVNAEVKETNYVYFTYPGQDGYLLPKEIVGKIVEYMNDAFNRNRITPDQNSTKIIEVSLGEVKAWYNYFFVWHANTQLKISIPEKQFTKIYEQFESSSQGPQQALAFTLHLLTWQIIDDISVQNYVLCR